MIRGAVRRIAVGAGFLTATTIGFKAWGQQHEQKFYALPPSFILELDLETNSLVECKSPSSLLSSAAGYRGELPLSHAVRAIHHAASDQRVAGLLGLIGILGGVSLAQVQELRDSVVEFRCASCRPGGGQLLVPTPLHLSTAVSLRAAPDTPVAACLLLQVQGCRSVSVGGGVCRLLWRGGQPWHRRILPRHCV